MNLCVDMALVPSAPLFLWSLLLLAIIVHIFKVFFCHLGNLLTCSCPHYPSVHLSPFSGMGPMYLPSGPAHQTILPFSCLLSWWIVSLCCVNQIWLKTKIWFLIHPSSFPRTLVLQYFTVFPQTKTEIHSQAFISFVWLLLDDFLQVVNFILFPWSPLPHCLLFVHSP